MTIFPTARTWSLLTCITAAQNATRGMGGTHRYDGGMRSRQRVLAWAQSHPSVLGSRTVSQARYDYCAVGDGAPWQVLESWCAEALGLPVPESLLHNRKVMHNPSHMAHRQETE